MPLGVSNTGIWVFLLAVSKALSFFLVDRALSQLVRQEVQNYLATAYIAGVDGNLPCARNARVECVWVSL